MMVRDEDIEKLDDRQQSRQKLPIFFGSRDNYYHGFREVLANASDEISNNFENGNVFVWLSDDKKTIKIRDTGRGIPFWGETNGVPNYELLFLTLFSGTNYKNLEKGKVSTGTNGVGATVLNYTSDYFKVRTFRDGKVYSIEFKDGGHLTNVEEPIQVTREYDKFEHGTEVTFSLDEKMYTNTTYSSKEIRNILFNTAGINNKLKIHFYYLDEETVYHFESMKDFFNENTVNGKLSDVFSFNQKEYKNIVLNQDQKEVEEINRTSLSLCLSTEVFQQTYLNYTNLIEHGSIYDGVTEGLKRFFNKNNLNNKLKFTTQDIEMSFSFISSVESTNCEFTSQTKFGTKKDLYKKILIEYVQDNMEIFKVENEKVFNAMLNHISTINKFNDNNDKKRKDLSKQLTEKATNSLTRPEKFIPCRSKDRSEKELILIEGDSAMNITKSGRDRKTMAIYPLKGKPMNPMKKNIDAILNNKEIRELFQILSCGVSYKGKKVKGLPEFSMESLEFKNILVMTDRDVDGGHIESLLIGVFYMLAPELIKQGRIWIIRTPLYIIKQKGKADKYLYSESEKNEYVKIVKGEFEETRYKGLGGLSPAVMNYSLEKETRVAIQLTFEDAEKCIEKIELFLSDETAKERKEFIETYSRDYFDYSLLEG